MVINITITNKTPVVHGNPVIVCGNSDYTIDFAFDEGWSTHAVKTARFVFLKPGTRGKLAYIDVPFSGSSVQVPILSGIGWVNVGVYAGELSTTTPAWIPCSKSILCESGTEHEAPAPDVYAQILALINAGITASPGVDGFSPGASVQETADGVRITVTDRTGTTTATLKNGKDGEPGVSPEASIEQTEDGVKITVKDGEGTTTANLKNGERGAAGAAIWAANVLAGEAAEISVPEANVATGGRSVQIGDNLLTLDGKVFTVKGLSMIPDSETGEEVAACDAVFFADIPGAAAGSGNTFAVLFIEQALTKEQQEQARKNIGAAAVGEGGGGSPDAVLYTEQTLTEEQQEQARKNIGLQGTGASEVFVITGKYSQDEVENGVDLDEGFSYGDMVDAIKAGRHVLARLEDQYDAPICHEYHFVSYSEAEGSAYFAYRASAEEVYELTIRDGWVGVQYLKPTFVDYASDQPLNEAQKALARKNIGAAAAGDRDPDAVRYTAQALTEEQKIQARKNIAAASAEVASNHEERIGDIELVLPEKLDYYIITGTYDWDADRIILDNFNWNALVGALSYGYVAVRLKDADGYRLEYTFSDYIPDEFTVIFAKSNDSLGHEVLVVGRDAAPALRIIKEEAVSYGTTQALTEEQKTLARKNIGAAAEGEGGGGTAGKSAYEYAQEAGYTGTEEEFAEKLALDPDWVATKTESGGDAVVIPEQTLSSGLWTKLQMSIQPEIVYDVHINGEVYPCPAMGEDGGVYLGNNPAMTANDYPFCIYWAGGSATGGMFYQDSSVLSYPLKLKVTDHAYEEYNQMPEGYLPGCVVKSVNGSKPDEKGNVEVKGGVDVTAEVGQTIIVEEVDASGKPTKWKSADYQPRTHWRDRVNVFPETEMMYDEGAFLAECGDFAIKAAKEYFITINGTEYAAVAQSDGEGNVWLGNPVYAGREDDGTPFTTLAFDGVMIVFLYGGETSATVKLDTWQYTKIPPEYVNSGAFYIDVTDTGDAVTTSVTCNEIINAQTAQIPMIVRLNDNYAICNQVAGVLDIYGGRLYFVGYTSSFAQVRVTLVGDSAVEDFENAPPTVTLTIMT